MINEDGETGQSTGLLLYYGKTVCDDLFTDRAARVICGEMGYPDFTSWRNSGGFAISDMQAGIDIGLDNVVCEYGNTWDTCTALRTTHNCQHHEDIYLTCTTDGRCLVYFLGKITKPSEHVGI